MSDDFRGDAVYGISAHYKIIDCAERHYNIYFYLLLLNFL